jgi:hypothetical protein
MIRQAENSYWYSQRNQENNNILEHTAEMTRCHVTDTNFYEDWFKYYAGSTILIN